MENKPTCETCRAFTQYEGTRVNDGPDGVCRVFPEEVRKYKSEHCFQYVSMCDHDWANFSHDYMGHDHRCIQCGVRKE